MGTVIVSCSADYSADSGSNLSTTFKVNHSSNFLCYSGTELIGVTSSRAANVNGNLWYQNWERPTNVTDAEREKVIKEFSKKREGAKSNISVTWKNFWVQQVFKGDVSYKDANGNSVGLGSDHMNLLSVFNNLKTTVVSWYPYEESVSEYEGQYEHINNFNNGTNTTEYTDDVTHEKYSGTTLMVNMGTDGRDEQFAYQNTIDSKYHYDYIILNIDGSYYVGFDFYANGENANQKVKRDWIFNDWIVKVSPAQKIGEEHMNPNLSDKTDGPVNPEDPGMRKGEIEVNLSMNALRDKDDYIYTNLSIHVRDTADVEVFIPVTPEYYCATDDMEIVLSHAQTKEIHSTRPDRIEYEINGYKVIATVNYEAAGIRIKTQGIRPEVLTYLRNNYADGLTIQIWNYYNDYAVKKGRNALKKMLDKSTVNFTATPDKYINAFARVNDKKNQLDCEVTPVGTCWNSVANDGKKDYNVIYTRDAK
jgi:hypothetical protein